MTLRSKFILFAVLVHGLMVVLAYFVLQQNKYLFLGMELLIICSIFVTFQLYSSFFKPLSLIRAGIESIRDKDFSTKFMAVGQQDLDELVNVYNRMIDQLRRERVAQAEKHFLLDKLIQASPAGIILLGFDNQVESINPAAERFLEKPASELLGKHISQLPSTWAQQLSVLPTGQSTTFRVHGIWTYRCHRAHFMDRGFQHYFVLIEELTEAILQNERQAYEKVIRVMSHEVNNTTGAINSILGSLEFYTPQLQEEHQPDFSHVLQVAIDRNTNLSRFMANFADVVRLPQPRKTLTDLHALLHDLHRLLKPELERRRISMEWLLAAQPLEVDLDRQQMEQALLNILKNAMEAIGEDGTIQLQTQHNPPQVVIKDSGGGIPEEVQQHLFTPFYTSKKTGQGIGLTMVRDILMNHGFTFSLSSNGSAHTSFTIRLH
ncbi:sensor histidine kinase [Pontibacter akesuensis]|uniref:histidine kinase n=1 Tax=Pontibacter akesuensis TaxID=388950 RepID=A0A1I7KW01_9BACT|nr:ATP-binding protein [Pontibacter akesuensis]GHA80402.1 sensor histidine kinase [Pontibacter akesuensis]SFV01597.1 Histidine kinase-, DNA gyrase B-, and HSP90-like ATPase [Pontibacter akesuensis]